jgi:hypothetical protein
MPPRCDSMYALSVPLCRSPSQQPLYFRNEFPVVPKLLSADCIFQRTEKMVVGRNQIRAVRWIRQESPLKLCDGLLGMHTCVWPRIVVVKKYFRHSFMETNPPETLPQSFHIDVRFDRLTSGLSARYIVAGVTAVDGRPESGKSDTLPCP